MSIAEMNFNYLHIDDQCLSYNQLLKKFVLNEEGSDKESQHNLKHGHVSSDSEKDKDHYYNVNLK